MQHFQSKNTSFVHILLLSIEKRIIFSLSQYFKERLGLAKRALDAAELRFMSASGRFMHSLVRFMRQSPFNLLFDHLQCTIDVLFGYFMLSPEGGVIQLIVNIFYFDIV